MLNPYREEVDAAQLHTDRLKRKSKKLQKWVVWSFPPSFIIFVASMILSVRFNLWFTVPFVINAVAYTTLVTYTAYVSMRWSDASKVTIHEAELWETAHEVVVNHKGVATRAFEKYGVSPENVASITKNALFGSATDRVACGVDGYLEVQLSVILNRSINKAWCALREKYSLSPESIKSIRHRLGIDREVVTGRVTFETLVVFPDMDIVFTQDHVERIFAYAERTRESGAVNVGV